MLDRGDWILMHLNGGVYGDKPPLFFWLIALSSYLWQGFTSFSVRFPSAVFGTLTVLLTFFLGKRLYSSRTGFFSGLVLATSPISSTCPPVPILMRRSPSLRPLRSFVSSSGIRRVGRKEFVTAGVAETFLFLDSILAWPLLPWPKGRSDWSFRSWRASSFSSFEKNTEK